MSESNRRRSAPTTPVPTSTLDDVRTMVASTHANVNIIRKEILPPLLDDTREARDTARTAIQGLIDHKENVSIHSHECKEQERQKQQDADIDSLHTKASDNRTYAGSALERGNHTNRLVWWVIGVAGTVLMAAGMFAISSRVTDTEHSSHIETNKSNIEDNDREIKMVRKTLITEIRRLPQEITEAARAVPPPIVTIDNVEDVITDFDMTEYEKRSIQRILNRVRKREAENITN